MCGLSSPRKNKVVKYKATKTPGNTRQPKRIAIAKTAPISRSRGMLQCTICSELDAALTITIITIVQILCFINVSNPSIKKILYTTFLPPPRLRQERIILQKIQFKRN